jgi:hypothetical protein
VQAASMRGSRTLFSFVIAFGLSATGLGWGSGHELPKQIRAIMEKPRYAEATWGLRVVDLKSGKVLLSSIIQQSN